MDVTTRDGAFADSSVAAFTRSRAAFDLKGVMSSLTVLRLRSRDLNLIERQLRAKVTQFPQFFQSAPIILDVGELEGGVEGFPLAALVRALSVCRVVPVAVTNIDDAHRHLASAAGLGIVQPECRPPRRRSRGADRRSPRGRRRARIRRATRPARSSCARARPANNRSASSSKSASSSNERQPRRRQASTPTPTAGKPRPDPGRRPAGGPGPGGHRAPMVIRQAVRSGQLIYAEKNDLIVLAPVNPGAQIVADGNIHVYATLRGRAVAGAKGYTDARIFCQKFEAELIAIAGAYLTFDDIPRDRMGKPSQVYLQNGACVIAPL